MVREDLPRMSVLVSTRDRPEALARCLASILANDHDSFEVVVVDQSEEPFAAPDDDRLVYDHSPTRGKSAGLNRALELSRADVLAFTDDDCTVPPDWLRRCEDVLTRYPHVSLVFGSLQPIEHDPTTVFVPPATFDGFRIVDKASRAHLRGGAGADMVARRSLYHAIGGYDEMIGPGSRFGACEEFDIYYRALAADLPVAFDPELATMHWGARPYADGSGRMLKRWYAYGEGAVIGKHLRAGDPRMAVVFLRITGQDAVYIAESLWHRRLAGIGQLAYKWRGLGRGLVTKVDRRRGVFVA